MVEKKREDKLFSEFSLKRNGTFRKKHVFPRVARSNREILCQDMNMRGMTIDGVLLNTMQSRRQSGGRKKKREVDDERN